LRAERPVLSRPALLRRHTVFIAGAGRGIGAGIRRLRQRNLGDGLRVGAAMRQLICIKSGLSAYLESG